MNGTHYGFVVDYLAEALRELRKQNYTESLDRFFSLGNHLNARDAKAVRKTTSGLVKLLHPHGEYSKEELIHWRRGAFTRHRSDPTIRLAS